VNENSEFPKSNFNSFSFSIEMVNFWSSFLFEYITSIFLSITIKNKNQTKKKKKYIYIYNDDDDDNDDIIGDVIDDNEIRVMEIIIYFKLNKYIYISCK